MNKVKEVFLIFLFCFFITASFLLVQIFIQENQPKFLRIIFLDVGQGDAVFIETPNGFQTLIDAGPNSTVIRSISKFIPFYDRSIDLLIATHSDADHVAGFVDVLNRFKIKSYAQNSIFDSDGLNTEINNLIDKKNVDKYFLNAGDKLILDEKENIYIEILWPIKNQKENDNNDNSVITRIVYGHTEIMLTGDASTDVENKLVSQMSEQSEKLKSDILKAGHHGSKTSTSLKFLEFVKPEYIIVSAGENNKFGHPHKDFLERVKEFQEKNYETKIKILETSVLGSIEFKSDGEKIWLSK